MTTSEEIKAAEPERRALESEESAELTRRMASLRFMIVDGGMGTCKTVRELVREMGARAEHISVCPRLLLAKQRLQISPVDVVISTLKLKDGTGTELLREFNASPTTIDSLFFVMTTDPTDPLAEESMNQGATSIIPKPITFSALKEQLQRTVSQMRTRGAQRIPIPLPPSLEEE